MNLFIKRVNGYEKEETDQLKKGNSEQTMSKSMSLNIVQQKSV